MTVYYIQRLTPGGVIIGLWGNQQTDPAIQYMDELPLDESDPEVQAFLNPPQLPINCPLSPDQFYTMLDNEGKFDAFDAAINTVTPNSKKMTCRNQFNNAQAFTWDMVLVVTVMPKEEVYGADWQTELAPIWLEAFNTLAPVA